jgi:thiosulfate/3-mercaptopyruvate sulfurtransferase
LPAEDYNSTTDATSPAHRTMNILKHSTILVLVLIAIVAFAFQATTIPHAQLIEPEELVKVLTAKGDQPLLIHVGFHVLYLQAHIPNSEYIGPASDSAALEKLRTRLKSLPRNTFIVIYCGCCPWDHCPNVKPAHDALVAMGFTNIKVLTSRITSEQTGAIKAIRLRMENNSSCGAGTLAREAPGVLSPAERNPST